MTSIVYQWQLLTKKEKAEGDDGKAKAEDKSQETEETLMETQGTHKPPWPHCGAPLVL